MVEGERTARPRTEGTVAVTAVRRLRPCPRPGGRSAYLEIGNGGFGPARMAEPQRLRNPEPFDDGEDRPH